MNKILSIVLIAVLLILSIALVSCKEDVEEGPNCNEGHTFVDEVVPSTCKEMGYTNHVCSVCGYKYKDNYSEKHHFVDTYVPATCDAQGYTSRVCSTCSYSIRVDFTPIDSKNHVEFKYLLTVDPTCTELGYDIEACVDCGYQHKVNYVASAHSFGEKVLKEEVGCGEYGVDIQTCVNCGLTKESLNTSAPHKMDNITVDSTTGKMTSYCDCGDYVLETDEYVNILNFELKTLDDGTQYYVVKGLDGSNDAKNATEFYVPFSIDYILVTEISAAAFMNNVTITSVRIAATVEKIGAFAFSGCTNLDAIYFDGTLAQWNALEENIVDGWDYGSSFEIYCLEGGVYVPVE
ncbi:MAG: leucine-rich repeat protein [Clostridia bacterium]|nr:leucine-rich repeat protein [Clostridia bacterium]